MGIYICAAADPLSNKREQIPRAKNVGDGRSSGGEEEHVLRQPK